MFNFKYIFKLELSVNVRYPVGSGKDIFLRLSMSVVWPHRPTAQTKIGVTLVDGVSYDLRTQT